MKDLFDEYRFIFDNAVKDYQDRVDNLPHDDLIDIANFIAEFYRTFIHAFLFVNNAFNEYCIKLGDGGN